MRNREEAMMRLIADINAAEIVSHIEDGTLRQWIESWRETTQIALSALRPVSREQVWRGEWLHDPETGYEHCDKCSHTISLDDYLNRKPPLFCEMCGDAKTDEAVEMVIERMEELHNA